MTPQQVVKHFGTQRKAAAALDLTQPTISNWVIRGRVPAGAQLRVQAATRGKLKADREALKKFGMV